MGEIIRCKHCGRRIEWFEPTRVFNGRWATSGSGPLACTSNWHEPMLKEDYIKKFNKIWKQQTS